MTQLLLRCSRCGGDEVVHDGALIDLPGPLALAEVIARVYDAHLCPHRSVAESRSEG